MAIIAHPEKKQAEDIAPGMVLATAPGSPAVTRVRRTRKGRVELWTGQATPIVADGDEQFWVRDA